MKGSGTTNTDTTSFTWTQAGTIAPGHAEHCIASTQTGTFDSLYTATIQITLNSNETFNMTQRGEYNSTGHSGAVSSFSEISMD
jgi:hypothetical protein